MRVARRWLISGEVQGDGRVEVLAEGSVESVEGFKHDLAAGPSHARVEQVDELNVEPTGSYSTFRIER
jgi:acylphosphatase